MTVKEREAEYCLNGYAVADMTVNLSLYRSGSDGVLRYNGQTLESNLARAAETHFGSDIAKESINQSLPLYTFTTPFDPVIYSENTNDYNSVEQYYIKNSSTNIYTKVAIPNKDVFEEYDGTTEDKKLYIVSSGHIFAVYLKGITPYISYANSRGVYEMIMDYIRDKTEMSKFFTVDQWIRLSPFIKEDEFNKGNLFVDDSFQRRYVYAHYEDHALNGLQLHEPKTINFCTAVQILMVLLFVLFAA